MQRVLVTLSLLAVCSSLHAQTPTAIVDEWMTPTPTAVPTVAPEAVRKAYMNCLFEVDKTQESLLGHATARKAETATQLSFCENRKKDCLAKKDGLECRTFVEEFSETAALGESK